MVWEEVPLIHKFSRLYNNSLKKGAKLRKLGVWHDDRWVWKFDWRRG